MLDPHHQDLYVNISQFLPVINNQTANPRSQGKSHAYNNIYNFYF